MHFDYYSFFVKDVELAPFKTKQALVKVLQDLEAAIVLADIPKLKQIKGFRKAYFIKIGQYKICIYKEKDKLLLARLLSEEELAHLLSPEQKDITSAKVKPNSPIVKKRTSHKPGTNPNPLPATKKTSSSKR